MAAMVIAAMGMVVKMKRKSKKTQTTNVLFALLDALIVMVSMVGALWLRYDFQFLNIDSYFLESIYHYLLINIICTVLINYLFKLYSILWRFASMEELKNVVGAVIASTVVQFIGMRILQLPTPRSYPLIYMILLAILMICSRFCYRFVRIAVHNR